MNNESKVHVRFYFAPDVFPLRNELLKEWTDDIILRTVEQYDAYASACASELLPGADLDPDDGRSDDTAHHWYGLQSVVDGVELLHRLEIWSEK
jgi:hypothetical protein